jgi:hypothetical protein
VADGAVEALKWIALLCMVVDHVNAALYGRELGLLADVVGRVAMPLFAGVFGYNLARPGVDLAKVQFRLVGFGLLALPAHAYLFGMAGFWPLNILYTFALAVFVIRQLQAGRAGLALAAFVVGGFFVEYWWPGVALVLACWAATRSPRQSVGDVAAVGFALAALCLLVNGNAFGLLAVPVAVLVARWAPSVPRLRGWFLWFYPLHLFALALIVQAM